MKRAAKEDIKHRKHIIKAKSKENNFAGSARLIVIGAHNAWPDSLCHSQWSVGARIKRCANLSHSLWGIGSFRHEHVYHLH